MIAQALRLGGYEAPIEQREHAPGFLRLGVFLCLGIGIGLFSFFRSFEHLDHIDTHGILFLLIYNGQALEALLSLLLATLGIQYCISRLLHRESSPDQWRLTLQLSSASLLFVALYFYFTYPNTAVFLWSENIFSRELHGGMRVLYTEVLFTSFTLLIITNSLLAIVARSLRGDYFDADHRRAFMLNLVPAVVAFISSLPRSAVEIDSIYLYVIATPVLYVAAFAMALQLEFGQEAD